MQLSHFLLNRKEIFLVPGNETNKAFYNQINRKKQMRLSVIYQILSQFSGINAILAYMTVIFQEF
jgi:Sugar (and other) transporter